MLIRRLVGLVCVVVLGGGLTGLMAMPAAADECPYVDESTGEIVYCDEDPGEPGEPGDPGRRGRGRRASSSTRTTSSARVKRPAGATTPPPTTRKTSPTSSLRNLTTPM